MSHLCEHRSAEGARCRHRIAKIDQPLCPQHQRMQKRQQVGVTIANSVGCNLVQSHPGAWRCLTHDSDSWEVAAAMGAVLPCRLPIPEKEMLALAEAAPLDSGTAWILAHGNQSIRKRVAANPTTNVDVLTSLAQDEDQVVRQQVAQNPGAGLANVRALLRDPNSLVRRLAASNPGLSHEALLALAKNGDRAVRRGVTARIDLPEDVRWELLQRDQRARQDLASNPTVPLATQRRLMEDEADSVRSMLSSNPACDPQVLEYLWEKRAAPMWSLLRNPSLPLRIMQEAVDHHPQQIGLAVARNPNAPVSLLLRMAARSAGEARVVAEHPALPSEELDRLAKTDTWQIQRSVSLNPNTSAQTLEDLSHVANRAVRWGIVRHRNTPPETLRGMLQVEDAPRELAKIQRRLGKEGR